jgi:DNA-binding protein H-NS
MNKSYASLQKQIAALQMEADAIKAKEVSGVVARIREAIEHYGLTPAEIFENAAVKFKTDAGKRGRKAGTARKSGPKGNLPPVKYRDEAGNVWSGRGPRPGWFKAAIESGKNVENYLVK